MKKVAIISPKPHTLPTFVVEAMQWLHQNKYCVCTYFRRGNPKHQDSFLHEALPPHIALLFMLGNIGRRLAFYLLRRQLSQYDIILTSFPYHQYLKRYHTLVYCKVEQEYETKRMVSRVFNFAKKYKSHFMADVSLPLANTVYTKLNVPVAYLGGHIEGTENESDVYTEDKYAYFFCTIYQDAYVEDVFYLLRSFSRFKKHTRTSLKLMLYFEDATMSSKCKLDTYQYADELIIQQNMQKGELNCLIRYAYALIYLGNPHRQQLAISEIIIAMYLKCPVLSVDQLWTRSLAGSGLIYFHRDNMSSLADAMKKIFADENLRKSLIEKNTDRIYKNDIALMAKSIGSRIK